MKEPFESEGGMLSGNEIGGRLQLSRYAVNRRRAAGRLLAVDGARRGYLYPACWQVVDSDVLTGFEEMLGLLAGHPPVEKFCFFLSANPGLGGERPLDRPRNHADLEPVRTASRTLGENSSPGGAA
jgi:biotin operon repressor